MNWFLTIFQVLGGLGLFIFGMNVMSNSLQEAAGDKLRHMLTRATKGRLRSCGLGSLLGLLIQSSAATVMLVGFINAGLLNLVQSVPLMLGANIGTTFAMQLVSFKLGDYAYVAVAIGIILRLAGRNELIKGIGGALLGFGLLFLGMNAMSEAIKPHRDVLAPFLAHIDGHSTSGMLLGLAIATGITAIIQSSGATIGMAFALISAGAITDLQGAWPIILGANIGTCMTALLGSIGTNIEARRSAVSHLTFNIYSAVFGILAAPYIYEYIPKLSSGTGPESLIRQAANANMIKMVASAAVILLIAPLFAKFIRLITPSKKNLPTPSFLDTELINSPEQALVASIRELQRTALICGESLDLNARLFKKFQPNLVAQINGNEKSVNAVKRATHQFLVDITRHSLSHRQAILVQHIYHCMSDIERIGDHIDRICELTVSRRNEPAARFSTEGLESFFNLYRQARHILVLVIRSLDPGKGDFEAIAREIVEAGAVYKEASMATRQQFFDSLSPENSEGTEPIASIYINRYISALNRIVHHAKGIALVEAQPQFWIKEKRLSEKSTLRDPHIPKKADIESYLKYLKSEEYL